MATDIGKFLGFEFHSLTDDGVLGEIETPFVFQDQDPVPLYVEMHDSTIRFFDDGEIMMRLMGWGIALDTDEDVAFLNALINPFGASLDAAGDIEVVVPSNAAPAGFAAYLSAMLAIVEWEKDPAAIAKAGESRYAALAAADA